jgi:hypothetical protein
MKAELWCRAAPTAAACAVRSRCALARSSLVRYLCDGFQAHKDAAAKCESFVSADNAAAAKALEDLSAEAPATVWTVGARISSLRQVSAKLQGDAAATVTALGALSNYSSVLSDRIDDGGQPLTEVEGRDMAGTLENVVAPGNLRSAAAAVPSSAARVALARDVSSRFSSVARLLAVSLLRSKAATLNERQTAALADGGLHAGVRGAAGLAIGAVRTSVADMRSAVRGRRWTIGGRGRGRRRLEDKDVVEEDGGSGEDASFVLPEEMIGSMPDDVTLVTVTNPGIYNQEEFEVKARESFITAAHGLSVLDAETDDEVLVEGLSAPIAITLPLLVGLPEAELAGSGDDGAPTVTCRFWDEAAGTWSARGCSVAARTVSHVTCNCSHLTEFAVTVGMADVISEVLEVAPAGAPTPFSSPAPAPAPAAAQLPAAIIGGAVAVVVVLLVVVVAVQRRRAGSRARTDGTVQGTTSVDSIATVTNPMKSPSDLKHRMQNPMQYEEKDAVGEQQKQFYESMELPLQDEHL